MATLDPKAGEDLTQKIDRVEQSIASDLQRGNSPDPTTQAAMEDATLLKSQLSKAPASPQPLPPPPTIPPPPPPVSSSPLPPVGSVAPRKPRSKLTGFLFLFFGLAVLIGLAIATGLFSQIAPKLGLGSTTVTYWGLWEPESVMRPVLDEFEKAHPGVKVEYKMESPQEYRERLQSALIQGKGPDIFRIHNTWVPMFRSDLASVPSGIYSASDYEKTFYPAAVSDFKSGGGFLAIPLEYDGIAMFINDDLISKSGQNPPQDWDQLRDVALAMSECASQTGACTLGSKILVSGVALGSTQNIDHWEDVVAVLMLQNNVNLANPASPIAKPAEDVLEYFNSFVRTYHIWDPNLPPSTSSFAGGRVGIYFGPSWRVFDIQAMNPNLRFSVYPIPQLPVDPVRDETPITYASYWAEAVNKKSPRAGQAWELLKFLSSPDILQKLHQQAVSSTRIFGEPYSRKDLAGSLKNSKYAGVFVGQAALAKSWYLASFTHDGNTGLNSRLSGLFAEALARTRSITTIAADINKVLSEYGLASPSAP